MLKALTDGSAPQLIWNWDAILVRGYTYTVEHFEKVCIVKIASSEQKRKALSLVGNETLDFGIIWVHMDSVAGEAVPLVLLVAADSMGAEDFFFAPMPGLTYSSTLRIGYICLCRSCAGNAVSYSFFYENNRP